MKRFGLSLAVLGLLGSKAVAKEVHFCWLGANGYSLTGSMNVLDKRPASGILTEDHVQNFSISGFHNGRFLGDWHQNFAADHTTWHLRFDLEKRVFLVGESFASTHSQGWNANGSVNNCGAPGFGFNSGSHAQDICLDGEFVRESSVPPDTPLMVSDTPFRFDCNVAQPLAKSK